MEKPILQNKVKGCPMLSTFLGYLGKKRAKGHVQPTTLKKDRSASKPRRHVFLFFLLLPNGRALRPAKRPPKTRRKRMAKSLISLNRWNMLKPTMSENSLTHRVIVQQWGSGRCQWEHESVPRLPYSCFILLHPITASSRQACRWRVS